MKKFFGANADFLGVVSSMTCAVHCMAVPLLASTGLMFTGHHNHYIDFILFGLGLIFAGFSLFRDALRSHFYWPLFTAVGGFVVLYLGITSHLHVLSVMGGLTIALSHFWNYKMSYRTCAV